jgi:FixJ family two-component response regulator/putative methionine-R-sulfoxide reductase with GAF domain
MSVSLPTVLVVDDERFFRDAIGDALREAGFACRAVAGADEALAALDDPAVGVVVLDLPLPGANGQAALRTLRARHPAVRVIVIATHADQEDVLEALRQGASDYLAKPLHDEELVLAVRRAVGAFALEARLATLRERVRALDLRMAALSAQAVAGDAGDRVAQLGGEIVAGLAGVLGAGRTSLMLIDAAGGELQVAAAVGADPDRMDRVAVGSAVAGQVYASGEASVVADLDAEASLATRAPRDRYHSRSFAVAPIPGPERALGVLCATDREDAAAFGEDDLALLQIFARHVGHLLAEPAASAEASAADTQTLAAPGAQVRARESAAQPTPDADAELARAICDVLAVEVEPRRLLDAALRPVARALSAAPVSLYLIDNATGELRLEGQCDDSGRGDRKSLPRQRGLTALVLQTGRVVATERPQSDPRFDPDVDTSEHAVAGPLLCVPLSWRGKVLGVVRAFPPSGAAVSARTGEVLAAALSAAVRNVFLYRSLLESIEDLAEARREARGPTS